METSERVAGIIAALKQEYPDALCALHYGKDYELMIAVRLSAQCTDARVNLVTPALFARYPTLDAFAEADVAEVEGYVHSCGFYKHKAEDIVLACRMLRDEYGGKVPGTMEQLLRLPGVGRKTANLLLGDIMGRPARSSATRTASVSATCWASPAARTRQRSSSSCARFCRRRNPPISATGSSCTAEPSARQESPRATAAASPHTAKALRGNEHACPFYVKSLKFNRSW